MATSSPSRRFDIRVVVEHYLDRPVPDREGFTKITCPTGDHEDRDPSCTISGKTGRIHCFSCDFTGDAIDLIKLREGVDFVGALRIGEEITGRPGAEVSRPAEKSGRRPGARISDDGTPAKSGDNRQVSAGGRRKPRRLG